MSAQEGSWSAIVRKWSDTSTSTGNPCLRWEGSVQWEHTKSQARWLALACSCAAAPWLPYAARIVHSPIHYLLFGWLNLLSKRWRRSWLRGSCPQAYRHYRNAARWASGLQSFSCRVYHFLKVATVTCRLRGGAELEAQAALLVAIATRGRLHVAITVHVLVRTAWRCTLAYGSSAGRTWCPTAVLAIGH